MPSDIRTRYSAQHDLDDLFELRLADDPKTAVTGVRDSAGKDLNQRYIPLSMGSPVSKDTGIRAYSSNRDIRSLFAAKNSVSRWPDPAPWDGAIIIDQVTASEIHQLRLLVYGDGTVKVKSGTFAEDTLKIYSPLPGSIDTKDVEVKCKCVSSMPTQHSNDWGSTASGKWIWLTLDDDPSSLIGSSSTISSDRAYLNLELSFREKSSPNKGTAGLISLQIYEGAISPD